MHKKHANDPNAFIECLNTMDDVFLTITTQTEKEKF